MWRRKKKQVQVDEDHPMLIYDRAQKLVTKYESTQDPQLLDEMRIVKPQLQEAVATSISAFENAPDDMAQLKAIPAMSYNILGGLCLYLKEYGEAWDYYEKSRQLAVESRVAKDIVQATNNLGSVALNQGDYEVALEQFELAERCCADLPFKDRWMRKHIERNVEMTRQRV